MAKNIEFDILARDRASQTFDKVGKHSDGLGSKLGSLGKIGALAVGGAAVGGIAALGAAMVNGVKDAASFQTLANKTAAVLKSTGNASRQSVKGIQERAAALESLSGVDEEIIINGQNVLATFTNVRDGVGKGNKVFSDATTAALNMSTALGVDMQGATIQVGKALNNPIKGVAALSRVGVSFTDAQKKQIRTLVESGKTMEAQKIILKELNTEFGGAAKAAGQGFNGAMARAKDAVGDAFRAIGTRLLPTLTRFADYVAVNAGPFIDRLSTAFGKVAHWASTVLWPILQRGYAAIMPALVSGFKTVAEFATGTLIPAIGRFVGWLRNDLWPAIQQGYTTIMPSLRQAFSIVAGAFKSTGGDGANFGEKLRKVGEIITTKVIPFVAKMISYYLPVLATNIRTAIEAVKAIYRAFETWRDIVARVIGFIIGRFADMTGMWATVLRALGRVPGFGWAKDAADKMQRASDKARGIANAINEIPNHKSVTINVSTRVTGGRIKVGGEMVNVGQFARGGINLPPGWKVVGEEGPELMWTPGGDTVIPAPATRKALAGDGGVRGSSLGGGGDIHIGTVVLGAGSARQQAEALWEELRKIKRQRGAELGLA